MGAQLTRENHRLWLHVALYHGHGSRLSPLFFKRVAEFSPETTRDIFRQERLFEHSIYGG